MIHNSAGISQTNDSTESSPSEWRDCCCSLFSGTMGGDVWMPALYHSSSRRRRMALWADTQEAFNTQLWSWVMLCPKDDVPRKGKHSDPLREELRGTLLQHSTPHCRRLQTPPVSGTGYSVLLGIFPGVMPRPLQVALPGTCSPLPHRLRHLLSQLDEDNDGPSAHLPPHPGCPHLCKDLHTF